MPSFFVARTHRNCEQRACNALRYRSCDVYFPVMRPERVAPLPFLPGCVFVADDGRGTAHIDNAPGVRHLWRCTFTQEPLRAPQRSVNEILRHEDADGFVVLMNKLWLQCAPDFDLIFQRMTGDTRVGLLLGLLVKEADERLAA